MDRDFTFKKLDLRTGQTNGHVLFSQIMDDVVEEWKNRETMWKMNEMINAKLVATSQVWTPNLVGWKASVEPVVVMTPTELDDQDKVFILPNSRVPIHFISTICLKF